ncbi:MAG: hypothetical protein WCT47_21535 [Betaproteobacteria bacterium]|jgi:hypothetical protein
MTPTEIALELELLRPFLKEFMIRDDGCDRVRLGPAFKAPAPSIQWLACGAKLSGAGSGSGGRQEACGQEGRCQKGPEGLMIEA